MDLVEGKAMTSHITHPAQGLIPRRTTPRPPVGVCGATPKGMLSVEPLRNLVCILPSHGTSVLHRNLLGQTWGAVLQPIDRVEERRPASW